MCDLSKSDIKDLVGIVQTIWLIAKEIDDAMSEPAHAQVSEMHVHHHHHYHYPAPGQPIDRKRLEAGATGLSQVRSARQLKA